MLSVRLRRLRANNDLPLPSYQTAHAAGMDLHADIPAPIVLAPGERKAVPTGIAIALPENFEAQVRPRSGLALRHGIGMVNAPGTIDADYRGEIHAILINLGSDPFTIRRGDRIAQLVVAPVTRVQWTETDFLDDTQRGTGGFGSTGVGGVPSGNFPTPSGHFPAPSGNFPTPSGHFPAPSGNFPAPSGEFPGPGKKPMAESGKPIATGDNPSASDPQPGGR